MKKIIIAVFILLFIQKALALDYKIIADKLNHPWGFVFLDDSRILISERNGDLLIINDGKKIILNLPIKKIFAQGQGGLLDLALHPHYRKNGWIYLTYSYYDDEKGATTALARFQIKAQKLTTWQNIYIANAYGQTSRHFGSRIAFDDEGYLYMSLGDRGKRHQAQNKANDIGSILRLYDDGTIPKDNPFGNAIYSYGHRNIQGLLFHNGRLIAHEHGPRGGDELNIIKKGGNYGWPVISYGREYISNLAVGETQKAGMAQPLHYWVPSIAPSGLAVYQEDGQNNLLIGSLKFRQLVRLVQRVNKIIDEQYLLTDKFGRIRDIKVYKGVIYLLTDARNGKLIKLITNLKNIK